MFVVFLQVVIPGEFKYQNQVLPIYIVRIAKIQELNLQNFDKWILQKVRYHVECGLFDPKTTKGFHFFQWGSCLDLSYKNKSSCQSKFETRLRLYYSVVILFIFTGVTSQNLNIIKWINFIDYLIIWRYLIQKFSGPFETRFNYIYRNHI